jgi:hypothetical protein
MSIILSLSPRLLLFLSETANGPEDKRTVLTSLESFLAVHASIWFSAVAISLVLNVSQSTMSRSSRYNSFGFPDPFGTTY